MLKCPSDGYPKVTDRTTVIIRAEAPDNEALYMVKTVGKGGGGQTAYMEAVEVVAAFRRVKQYVEGNQPRLVKYTFSAAKMEHAVYWIKSFLRC